MASATATAAAAGDAGAWRRTVVLRHELQDGTHHFDWLLATDEPPRGQLLAARLPMAPNEKQAGAATMAFEPIALHRPRYLEFEGAIEGGRGWVRRVGSGWWRAGLSRLPHGPLLRTPTPDDGWPPELEVRWMRPGSDAGPAGAIERWRVDVEGKTATRVEIVAD